MSKDELDKYCLDILGFFLVYNQKIRFNELYNRLTEKMNYKISRPTLAEHLKHLVKQKEIIRKKEGKQNVSYQFNGERYLHMKKAIEIQNELSKVFSENEKRFNELSIDDQLTVCITNMILRNLRQLRIEINEGLNPDNRYESRLEVMFINNPVHRFYERKLFNDSVRDREYGEKVLKKLDEAIEDTMKELYEKPVETIEKLKKLTSN